MATEARHPHDVHAAAARPLAKWLAGSAAGVLTVSACQQLLPAACFRGPRLRCHARPWLRPQGLPKGAKRDRLASKFVESEFEKVDRLMELLHK